MPIFTENTFHTIPLSLYIHLPWCVRKCPYCDFNSHQMKDNLPEELYVAALLSELNQYHSLIQERPIKSIFFGGGTPSLFSGKAIKTILEGVKAHLSLAPDTEITLEANPGTIDQVRFHAFRAAGINRLSLGIQSLQNEKLKTLGRIHDTGNAIRAIELAKEAGFTNFNIDLMFGLPEQTIDDALHDIELALSFSPAHFSWYQLTIEPNTLFYHQPPPIPADESIWEMQLKGQARLAKAGFNQYEISAYALPGKECRHNYNYWEYGDYLGIGAGAHSKITNQNTGDIVRFSQVKNPRDYLDLEKRKAVQMKQVTDKDRAFEFMLNALRLTKGVSSDLFTARTGLLMTAISHSLDLAKKRGLLIEGTDHIQPTELGKRFLNNVIELFLP